MTSRPKLTTLAVLCLLATGCEQVAPFCGDQPPPCTFEPWDYGCAEGEEPPCATTAPEVEGRRVESFESPLAGARVVYFVQAFAIPPPPSGSDSTVGFDLDGLDSGEGSSAIDANCEEFNADFHSLDDPQHRGVDNGLGSLVRTAEAIVDPADCPGRTTEGCVDAHLDESIADGTFGLAIVVSGLDDLAADPEVSVALHEATLLGPERVSALAPDRVALGRALREPVAGSVFDGRLRARFGRLDIPWPRSGLHPLPPDTHRRVELRFDLDGEGPRAAVLGGAIEVDDFLSSLEADVGIAELGDTLRAIIESVSDLSPSETDPQVCRELSVGYALEVIQVVEE